MNHQKGQALMELLIAMGVFVLSLSAIIFLVFDAYTSNRAGKELTAATFLAEEGLEAARSIRDNSWDDLSPGEHGLNAADKWSFKGGSDTINDKYIRTVIVEEIDANRKKVTSKVTWDITRAREGRVKLTTRFTNWQREGEELTCANYCQSLDYTSGQCVKNNGECVNLEGTVESEETYCSPPNKMCCCFDEV